MITYTLAYSINGFSLQWYDSYDNGTPGKLGGVDLQGNPYTSIPSGFRLIGGRRTPMEQEVSSLYRRPGKPLPCRDIHNITRMAGDYPV